MKVWQHVRKNMFMCLDGVQAKLSWTVVDNLLFLCSWFFWGLKFQQTNLIFLFFLFNNARAWYAIVSRLTMTEWVVEMVAWTGYSTLNAPNVHVHVGSTVPISRLDSFISLFLFPYYAGFELIKFLEQFQRRTYAKLGKFHTGKKGYGLQLKEDVSEGRFLIEYVGEVVLHAAYRPPSSVYSGFVVALYFC